ncbi:hypothetical protein [Microbulbifer rhizosphaerae]|uniref:Uncharacterized protein n=1 Tax=Microbulbifer rhizosphaerae TaxID=1562603 RepID=A0A7W4WDF2_9GAMM|nr:hypothetical protein [Microbulbifer rhizosphaerae]MBB3061536.1 hypothetical protein [Microbulbifer rhizosphaerae]
MKYAAILFLTAIATSASTKSDLLNLRIEDERLIDVWTLVENFCAEDGQAKPRDLQHPDARISIQLEQVSCVDAYKALRKFDGAAKK